MLRLNKLITKLLLILVLIPSLSFAAFPYHERHRKGLEDSDNRSAKDIPEGYRWNYDTDSLEKVDEYEERK